MHTHTHTELCYSGMRKKKILTFLTMDEPGGHYAKGNKPDTENQINTL